VRKQGGNPDSVSFTLQNQSWFNVPLQAAAAPLEMIGDAYAGIISAAGLCLISSMRFIDIQHLCPWTNGLCGLVFDSIIIYSLCT